MRENLVVRIAVAMVTLAPVLCRAEPNITRAEVYVAVKSAFQGTPLQELKFGAGQLIMPGAVMARTTTPSLRVLQATINRREGVVGVRLCCEHYACLPFLVSIKAEMGDTQVGDVSFSWKQREAAAHPDRGSTFVLRQGASARLTVEEDSLRISVPVTCLQPGAVGQVIRVRVVGTNRVTNAYVKSPTQLLAADSFVRGRQ